MKAVICAATVAFALTAIAPASASKWSDPHASWHSPSTERSGSSGRVTMRGSHGKSASAPTSSGVGPRPSAWCGWYMRTRHGGGPEMNLAWNWRNYGSPASPQVGAIVVWRHHVGEIVGQAANGHWLVHSGNDGGAVRTRARSIAGAVIRI